MNHFIKILENSTLNLLLTGFIFVEQPSADGFWNILNLVFLVICFLTLGFSVARGAQMINQKIYRLETVEEVEEMLDSNVYDLRYRE